MAKHNATETFDDQKEKLFEAIDELRESLNLSDEDMEVVKEWGIKLLVTGVSVYIAYRLIRTLLGYKKGVPVLEAKRSSSKRHIREASPISRMIKEQIALFLVAFIRQRIVAFLEEKGLLVDEEKDS